MSAGATNIPGKTQWQHEYTLTRLRRLRMTYECSGCGLRSCSGECFHESRSDYETPQEAHKRRVKFWADIMALRDADASLGDPFEKRRRVA